ncbi:MAG: ParA family partition ATPase [Pseudomonadota bacterium]
MAARVFTLAQQKGGAGKTTLAAHLAVAWSLGAKRVAVVDIDPQASLTQWVELRRAARAGDAGFTFTRLAGWRLAGEAERLSRDHDAVLIDSPPHAETEARIAIRAASLVVVPVQPSPMDWWATRQTLEIARAERRKVLLVVNRMPARTNLAQGVVDELAASDVGAAKTLIGNRVAFASSLAAGRGITEAEPGSRAAAEIAALAAEIWERPE